MKYELRMISREIYVTYLFTACQRAMKIEPLTRRDGMPYIVSV